MLQGLRVGFLATGPAPRSGEPIGLDQGKRAISNLNAVAVLAARFSRGTGMLDLQGPCHASDAVEDPSNLTAPRSGRCSLSHTDRRGRRLALLGLQPHRRARQLRSETCPTELKRGPSKTHYPRNLAFGARLCNLQGLAKKKFS